MTLLFKTSTVSAIELREQTVKSRMIKRVYNVSEIIFIIRS
jgi:hypothetical protein